MSFIMKIMVSLVICSTAGFLASCVAADICGRKWETLFNRILVSEFFFFMCSLVGFLVTWIWGW